MKKLSLLVCALILSVSMYAQLVSSITITPTNVNMSIGNTFSPTISVLPVNALNDSVYWTTSNSSVAIVSQNGQITALANGIATISATASDGSNSWATCEVTVSNILISAINISSPKDTIAVGESIPMQAQIYPIDATIQSITWTSNSTNIVTINPNGVITGVSPGISTIKAMSNDGSGIYGTKTITVVNSVPPTAISFPYSTQSIVLGQTFLATPVLTPSNATTGFTWTSSNVGVAMVANTGMITPLNAGTTTITCATTNGLTASFELTVTSSASNILVNSVMFLQNDYYVNPYSNINISPYISPATATNKRVTYTVNPSNLGSVDSSGLFISNSNFGIATVVATSIDGTYLSDTCFVHVSQTTEPTVSITPTSLNILVGGTSTITFMTNPQGTPVTISSSNPAIASVNPNGVVTGVAAGTAEIKVQITGGNYYATCNVTVMQQYIPPTAIEISQTSIQIPVTATGVRLSAKALPLNATNRYISWRTGDSSIAIVNQNGVIFPIQAGSTYVYASTFNGIEMECNVIITGVELPTISAIYSTPDTIFIQKNNSTYFQIQRYPLNAEYIPLTYTILDTSILCIEQNGIITGRNAGVTTITATVMDYPYITTSSVVKVLDEVLELQPITLEIDTLEYTIGSTNIVRYNWDEIFNYTGNLHLQFRGYTWDSHIAELALTNTGFGLVAKNPGYTTAYVQAESPSGLIQNFEFEVKIISPTLSTICNNLDVTTTITNVNCAGANTGQAIASAIGGTAPYTYRWSNFRSDNKILNVPAGTYFVTVTDRNYCTAVKYVEISEPDPIDIFSDIEQPSCGNTDGRISIQTIGGEAPYSIRWNTNATTSTITDLDASQYNVRVTDSKGCVANQSFELQNSNAPILFIENVMASNCNPNNGLINIGTFGGTGEITYEWQDAITTEDRNNIAPGNYTLTATDENNCKAIIHAVVPGVAYSQPQISLVTVGQTTGDNLIIWEKENTDAIEFYTIYRELTPGVFEEVDTVMYNSASIFSDNGVNSATSSYRYRISATDYCGFESEVSAAIAEFKTINTTIDVNPNRVIINWDAYEGFNYTSYIIYKIVGNDTIEITRVPPLFNTYTYTLTSGGASAYFVAVELPKTLDPYGLLKSESGPFVLAMSNIAEVENSIETVESKTAGVYPTIVYNSLTIDVGDAKGISNIEIFSSLGVKVYQANVESTKQIQVPVEKLAKGEYIVKVSNAKETFTSTIIIR